MKFMRAHLKFCVLVAISLFGGLIVTIVQFRFPGPGVPSQWTTVTFQNPSIQVQFPNPPRHRVEQVVLSGINVPTPQGIFTAQGEAGASYMLTVITYPGEVPPLEQDIFLKNELIRLVPGASLIAFDPVTPSYPQGTLSRDFVMQNNAEGTYVQGRIVRSNATLYTLTVIYPNGYFPEKAFDHFIQSFLYVQ